jgi:hypothetical protein
MNARKAHDIWMEQCEAALTIKARYGIAAAFDYLVGEKLMNFANAASGHPDFATELPRFVSAVRRMFTPAEIRMHLAQIETAQTEEDDDDLEEDALDESLAAAEHLRRFMLVKELLTVTTLGTS